MADLLDSGLKGFDPLQERFLAAARRGRLHHALLFSGPEGVGKKRFSLALARALMCEKPPAPCGRCFVCKRADIQDLDAVLSIAPEGLVLKIGDVRPVLKHFAFRPLGPAQIALIDSAHLLSREAANFLLKIIEEPPPKSWFFLITSFPSRLPPTLLSRLQETVFPPLSEEILKDLCPKAEAWMIRSARGSIARLIELGERAALRLFAVKLFESLARAKNISAFVVPAEIKDRKTALFTAQIFQQLLRDARVLQTAERRLPLIHEQSLPLLQEASARYKRRLNFILEKALALEREISSYKDPILSFERFGRAFV